MSKPGWDLAQAMKKGGSDVKMPAVPEPEYYALHDRPTSADRPGASVFFTCLLFFAGAVAGGCFESYSHGAAGNNMRMLTGCCKHYERLLSVISGACEASCARPGRSARQFLWKSSGFAGK